MATVDEREGIADFAAANVGEARTKEIASDNEIGEAALANGGLRINAVGQAGLVVARIAGAGNVDTLDEIVEVSEPVKVSVVTSDAPVCSLEFCGPPFSKPLPTKR